MTPSPERRFLLPSATYYELLVLVIVEQRKGLRLPVDPHELPLESLEAAPLGKLIASGSLVLEGDADRQLVVITNQGHDRLRRLIIDYHLELMSLREISDDFFRERVRALESMGAQRVLLYGASDTARVLLECLSESTIVPLAVIDDDHAKQGTLIGSIPVIAPSRITELAFDTLLVTTVAFEDRILARRDSFVPPGVRILSLFDPVLAQAAKG